MGQSSNVEQIIYHFDPNRQQFVENWKNAKRKQQKQMLSVEFSKIG